MIAADNLGVDPAIARMRLIPKPSGGNRAICELEPSIAAAYRTAVARVVPSIERRLGHAVTANRARAGTRDVLLEPAEQARRRFEGALRLGSARHRGPLLVADVLDCYASISLRAVLDAIPEEATEIARIISRLREGGVDGLPVGPDASAVLANAVLSVLDEVVSGSGAEHVRWVDDLYVFTDSERQGRALLDRLKRRTDRLGLTLNDEKTGPRAEPGSLARAPSGDDLRPLA